MARPRLIVVSGPPGSGKTTLAHALAAALPCPALCRDEIREGLVAARGAPPADPDADAELARLTNQAFFDAIRLLLEREVTLVAEAAFQHRLWAPGLEPLLPLAETRVVRCRLDAAVARGRIAARLADGAPTRSAHHDAAFLARVERGEVSLDAWEPIRLDVPTLVVDTTDGYAPPLADVVAFARG